jgi:2-succinyl-5-enolpyruvyl-6-hydroxy-3-cyclohexene-1-carboxylate synthase
MSVRHASIFYGPAKAAQPIYSGRGVNGIDGTIGTFVGQLLALRQNGLLVIGDKAFIHDIPSLSLGFRRPVRGTICVVNNGGGGIFDFLPAASLPGYTEAVRNPTSIHVEAIAAAFGLPYARCEDAGTLAATLRQRSGAGDLAIVEVQLPPDSLREGMEALYHSMDANA